MRLPTVLNIEGAVIVFGGGAVGMRKVEYLGAFGADITVVDEEDIDLPEGVDLVRRRITLDNLTDLVPAGTALVVAALSSRELNHGIANLCRSLGVMVNVVDTFPGLYAPADLQLHNANMLKNVPAPSGPWVVRAICSDIAVAVCHKATLPGGMAWTLLAEIGLRPFSTATTRPCIEVLGS